MWCTRVQIVTELRNRHARGESHSGINVRRGSVTNMLEENVVQPLLVSTSALTLATECVRMILKVRDHCPMGGAHPSVIVWQRLMTPRNCIMPRTVPAAPASWH